MADTQLLHLSWIFLDCDLTPAGGWEDLRASQWGCALGLDNRISVTMETAPAGGRRSRLHHSILGNFPEMSAQTLAATQPSHRQHLSKNCGAGVQCLTLALPLHHWGSPGALVEAPGGLGESLRFLLIVWAGNSRPSPMEHENWNRCESWSPPAPAGSTLLSPPTPATWMPACSMGHNLLLSLPQPEASTAQPFLIFRCTSGCL